MATLASLGTVGSAMCEAPCTWARRSRTRTLRAAGKDTDLRKQNDRFSICWFILEMPQKLELNQVKARSSIRSLKWVQGLMPLDHPLPPSRMR